jgi:hypothetical protein
MRQNSWWLGSALLVLATYAGGVRLGYLLRATPDGGPKAPAAPDKQESNAKPPASGPDGIRLERFKDSEGLLELIKDAGQPTFVRKLSGNKYVKIWAEVKTCGELRCSVEVSSIPLVRFGGPIEHYEGKFTWLRRHTGSPTRESWSMRMHTKNSVSFANNEVGLFDRFGLMPIKSVREIPAPVHEVPDPLPIDRPVCLDESRLVCDFDDRFQAASDVGLLGSAVSTNPLTAAATLAAPRLVGMCTVRLMCEVEPEVAVPEK